MTLHDVEKTITIHLKKHYNERGKKDFFFKCNKLPLAIDNRVIGRVVVDFIEPKGIVELWSTKKESRSAVWKTCFNGGT
jgi:hypothetical protein